MQFGIVGSGYIYVTNLLQQECRKYISPWQFNKLQTFWLG